MPKPNMELTDQNRHDIVHWAKLGLSVSEICRRIPGLTHERCRGWANKRGYFFPTQRRGRPNRRANLQQMLVDPQHETIGEDDEISNESLAHLESGEGDAEDPGLMAPRQNSAYAATERITRLEQEVERLKEENRELREDISWQVRQNRHHGRL